MDSVAQLFPPTLCGQLRALLCCRIGRYIQRVGMIGIPIFCVVFFFNYSSICHKRTYVLEENSHIKKRLGTS